MKKLLTKAAIVALFASSLAACGESIDPSQGLKEAYESYKTNATQKGESPLSYEEWLEAIRNGGLKGDKGDKGDTGAQGEKGDKGDKGDTGEKGDTGAQGEPGKDGADGKDGVDGQDGQDGAPGEKGEKGDKGDKGDTGAQGEKGDKGDKGDTGAQGEKGDKGDTGDKGADGNGVLTGEGVPAADLGVAGDSYIDTETWNYYVKESTGWVLKGNIKGDNGAGWDTSVYTVTFMFKGEVLDTQEVVYGHTASRPAEPQGFHITGWYTLEDGYKEYWNFRGCLVLSDVTLYADYEGYEYTVSFVDHRFGESITPVKVKRGEAYTLNAVTHNSDVSKHFVTDDGELFASNGVWALESDVTLHVSWERPEDKKTITLNPGDGSVDPTEKTVYYGDYYSLPNAVNLDHEFACWTKSGTEVPSVGVWADNSATSFTLEAKYYDVVTPNAQGVIDSVSTSLKYVKIASTATSIAKDAFKNHTNLQSVYIPDSVTTYGEGCFQGCTNLTTVRLSKGATKLGKYMFWECTKLKQITIPEEVTALDIGVFEGTGLTSVVLPSGITELSSAAFRICSQLESIVLPAGLTSIESNSLQACSSLTSIVIPAGVTKLGTCAFYQCTSLSTINLPAALTRINDLAFGGCTAMTSIYIPIGVTTVGEDAFQNCTALTINAAAPSKPAGWHNNWNPSNRPVNWNYQPA